jgi:hypothetical protein
MVLSLLPTEKKYYQQHIKVMNNSVVNPREIDIAIFANFTKYSLIAHLSINYKSFKQTKKISKNECNNFSSGATGNLG